MKVFTVPYEAIVNEWSGDCMFSIHGEHYFDYKDIWFDMNNYDIILQDNEGFIAVGHMTYEQFQQLKQDQGENND